MSSSPRARELPTWLPPAVALVPFAVLVWCFRWVSDDAFISFRYARNLARGEGLVYNPGERVEGFTNLLWTLWVAVGELLGADPRPWSTVTSALCGAALVVLLVRFCATRVARGPTAALATALFVGTYTPLAVWSTGGLATLAFALSIFAAFERLLGDPERPRGVQAGLCAALAVLLRADGFGWVALLVAAGLLVSWRGRRPELARATATLLGLAAAVLAGVVAWRLAYYGAPLPNTARAKVGLREMAADPEVGAMILQRGVNYLVSYVLAFPSFAVALALGLSAARRPARDREGWGAASAIVVAGTALYCLVIGGDFMTMGRFLVPAVPFAAIAFALGIERVARLSRPLAAGLALACAVLSLLPACDVHVVPRAWREAFHFRWNERDHVKTEREMWAFMKENAEKWTLLGRALRLHVRPGESMTLGPIGAVGYECPELVILDTYGLTNRAVAEAPTARARKSPGHDKLVPMEFFDRYEPTYYGATLAPGPDPAAILPRSIADDPRFSIEVDPLSPADGFPPGLSLIRIRNRS